MKKVRRVARKKDFDKVMDGTRVGNSYFSVFYCENNLDYPRVGVTIGKKKARKAVERNFVKRQIRSIMSENYKSLSIYDIIVVVSKKGKDLDYQQKKFYLNRLLTAKGLMEDINEDDA